MQASVSYSAAQTSDLIDLRGGDHFRGNCLDVQEGVLSWRTTYGTIIHVPVCDIVDLSCEKIWDLQLCDYQVIRSSWAVSNGVLVLNSGVFGTLRCDINKLRAGAIAVSAHGVESGLAATVGRSTDPGSTPQPPSNEAPPSSLQSMLRNSSILLRPKQWNLSSGFQYVHDRVLYSPDDTRQLNLASQLQYGITPRIQASLQWPVFLTNEVHLIPPTGTQGVSTSRSTVLRPGNPELSAAFMLSSEGQIRPECVVITGLTIPDTPASRAGVFKSRVGLEFLKTSDPGALFGGIGWIHEGDGWQSSPYKPIDRVTYHVGAAVGLNDELAIGFQAQGIYSPELHGQNGVLLSTQQEPVEGRFWFNFRTSQHSYVEPAVQFPLSSDAHSTVFEITYIKRY